MTKLQIARGLELPLDAVTETFAVLGRRGSGKTHTASVLAEELLGAGLQCVIIDPLDVWWGLRVGADGKSPGFPIVVFGGQHADVPLDPDAGAELADVVVEQRVPAIFSTRHLNETEKRRFVAEFASRLYLRKGAPEFRDPLHVFLDEADTVVPQRLYPGTEKAFHAIDQLVRRGRSSGLGTTLISQRAAVINKDVLTQTEVIIAHQTTGPQDRKALEAWIEAHDTGDHRKEFLASVAALQKGEAWIWSPAWLDLFKRAKVRARKTFDSSSTPKAGEKRVAPQQLTPVDLEALRERLAVVVEKARADDPKALRARIAELEHEKRQLENCAANLQQQLDERVPEPVLDPLTLKVLQDLANENRKASERIELALARAQPVESAPPFMPMPAAAREEKPANTPPSAQRLSPISAQNGAANGLPKCERALLMALAQHGTLTLDQAAIIAGYSPAASTTGVAASKLKKLGLVDGSNASGLRATKEGLRKLGRFDPLPTGRALAEHWYGMLGKCERELLRRIVAAYPRAVTLEAVAKAAGYSTTASTTGVAAAKLRRLQLVSGGNAAMVANEKLVR